jgi:peptidoglycan/xylan/chitin deacetylase (PgdA/CDA1 family)
MIKRLAALGIGLAWRAGDLLEGGVRRLMSQPARRRGVILYYHAVKPHQQAGFARQMDTLASRSHLFSAGAPEGMTAAAMNVALTFDDGFRSVVDCAVPELKKRGIPFTLFVPAGCLGERPSWVKDGAHPSSVERVLSAAELRALAAEPLATIGSHTLTHRNLRTLDAAEAERELVQSKADLEDAAGYDVGLFSFPHGAHTPALVAQARQAGYRRVYTVEPELVDAESNAFVLGRVAVEPNDWPIEFRLKIAGAYRWWHSLHRCRQALAGRLRVPLLRSDSSC